ncbi:Wadjet anti-phage system protein JetD domain-containing protein [Arthrobacter sp. H41]|uniref:Wadjet anti-phage system protein JetD domain-containing protein n=1 Tax=Arthrobacter sp. H41 TaxID=1312978 RepID=UPI00047C7F06|nr:Wadjet anti-phage system protein JetD domain-containing protein [Arthrobacter sp. H41]
MPADARPAFGWTTLAALRAQSSKAWDRGTLLRELVQPSGAYPRRRALKHPTAGELRSEYAAARQWAADIHSGASGFSVETAALGRTTIGANQVPVAVVFDTALDEARFLGRTRQAGDFLRLAAGLGAKHQLLAGWAADHPIPLLTLGADAMTAAEVALWLAANPGPGTYLRQLSLPGVHTKFVEAHRQTIDQMVEVLQPRRMGSGVFPLPVGAASSPAARFAARHGFLHPPELVRFRLLDQSLACPELADATDLTVTAEAFRGLRFPVKRVLITENLVNFLSLPEAPRTLALFGKGYGFSAVRDAFWLSECPLHYWGDLDTHGFRILDQLRSVHPHVESVLMDEETLLTHRALWGTEPTPSRAELTRLTGPEGELYRALRNDVHGPSVRLEQELIGWDYAVARLASS